VHDRGGESQLTTPTRICAVGVSPVSKSLMMNLKQIIALGTRDTQSNENKQGECKEIVDTFDPVTFALTESNLGVVRLRLTNEDGGVLNIKAGKSVELPKKGKDLDKIRVLINDYVVYYGTIEMKDRETGERLLDEDGDPRLAAWFTFGASASLDPAETFTMEDIFEIKKPAPKPARGKVRPA